MQGARQGRSGDRALTLAYCLCEYMCGFVSPTHSYPPPDRKKCGLCCASVWASKKATATLARQTTSLSPRASSTAAPSTSTRPRSPVRSVNDKNRNQIARAMCTYLPSAYGGYGCMYTLMLSHIRCHHDKESASFLSYCALFSFLWMLITPSPHTPRCVCRCGISVSAVGSSRTRRAT